MFSKIITLIFLQNLITCLILLSLITQSNSSCTCLPNGDPKSIACEIYDDCVVGSGTCGLSPANSQCTCSCPIGLIEFQSRKEHHIINKTQRQFKVRLTEKHSFGHCYFEFFSTGFLIKYFKHGGVDQLEVKFKNQISGLYSKKVKWILINEEKPQIRSDSDEIISLSLQIEDFRPIYDMLHSC